MDVDHFDGPNDNICNSTITYMLDGNVGLAADLALMAQAAALARERNRTFFVDDTYWTRGKWTDYFQDVAITQQGPEPGCSRPPPEELLAKYHFGHQFQNHYENSYGHDLNRARPIFEHSETSFSTTIQPNEKMTNLINTAKQELLASISTQDPHLNIDEHNTAESDYISVHIRRGDRIPHGWEYHRKPIPIKEYVDAVLETIKRTQEIDSSKPPVVYVASDSPAAIDEFNQAYHFSTFAISKSVHSDVRRLSSPKEYRQDTFDAFSLEERRSLTKGALIDLALVTGLWDSGRDPHLHATICSVSSNFGRLAVIGLGWDKAFGNVNKMGEIDQANKRWVDVDLKGHEIPVWEAFELF
ncbi:hypothetical protein EST38_g3189 [Candolleomyces aberdarensis]|uniref:Uncharacterized protein n=1 Tax=Candolleomyces aberdarensis TaxID=2316362 RepID=A0A4V1Q4N2_9AGAR|nr:hypothetical protein EST38_g3189 [Candolleomyces aberdarensis]